MRRILFFLLFSICIQISLGRDFEYHGLMYTIVSKEGKLVETKHGTRIPYDDRPGVVVSGSIVIPEKVYFEGEEYTVIGLGYMSFINSPQITSVTLPETIEYIEEYAIHRTGIEEMIFPESVKKIGTGAIFDNHKMTKVKFGSKITSLGSGICKGDENLKEVDLGNIPYIPKEMFEGCESLESIIIPAEVKEIGSSAFYGCKDLRNISFLGTTPPKARNSFSGLDIKNITVSVPDGYLSIFLDSSFKDFKSIETSPELTFLKFKNYTTLDEIDRNFPTWGDFYKYFRKIKPVFGNIEDVNNIVQLKVNKWKEKDEFETTAAWQERITDSNVQAYTQEVTNEYMSKYNEELRKIETEKAQLQQEYNDFKDEVYSQYYAKKKNLITSNLRNSHFELRPYDADNEEFIVINSNFGEYSLKVPLALAKEFKQNWEKIQTTATPVFDFNDRRLALKDVKFTYLGNDYIGRLLSNLIFFD